MMVLPLSVDMFHVEQPAAVQGTENTRFLAGHQPKLVAGRS